MFILMLISAMVKVWFSFAKSLSQSTIVMMMGAKDPDDLFEIDKIPWLEGKGSTGDRDSKAIPTAISTGAQ